VSRPSSGTGKKPAARRHSGAQPAARRHSGAQPAARRHSGAQPAARRHSGISVSRSLVLQRLGILAFVVAAAVALLLVPSRGYVAQQQEISANRSELTDLKRQNQELLKRRDRLDDPAEIQRIARRDFGLVLEGEESYSILPPASAGLVLPQSWPFNLVQEPLEKASLGSS